jgi:ABC-2 type transport system ATP-binding protein
MISAHRLIKKFGNFTAVDSVDLEIPTGQVVGFLGPNGAGKTTTIRMICGYLRPTSGTVRLDGIDVAAQPRKAQEKLGYLPESAPLYTEMRVGEYLTFRARLYRVPRKRRAAAIDKALQQCSLTDVRRRPIQHLSRGYRQRVGLAATLVHEPPVLILDEPTAGLDPTQVREVRQLIRRLAGGRTILLSSHNLAEVELTCDRIVMLAAGRVRAEGAIDELRRSSGRYVVECDVTDACGALAGLAGVGKVECVSIDDRWKRVTISGCNGTEDLREPIAKAVTARGGTVRELHRESDSLERLFVQMAEQVE